MGKKLSVSKAKEILEQANEMNPGGWYDHSLVVGEVAYKIAEALNLDKEKAKAFGYIHDIGRRVGRCALKHIYEGYKYLTDLGYTDAARICLTHSFFEPNAENVIGNWDMKDTEKEFVKKYINNTTFDIYDRIIQMADTIALSTGVTTLERRMVDVFFRYGFDENTEYNFRVRLKLQNEIEEKLGYPIYKLFEKEITNELITDRVYKVVRFWK